MNCRVKVTRKDNCYPHQIAESDKAEVLKVIEIVHAELYNLLMTRAEMSRHRLSMMIVMVQVIDHFTVPER